MTDVQKKKQYRFLLYEYPELLKLKERPHFSVKSFKMINGLSLSAGFTFLGSIMTKKKGLWQTETGSLTIYCHCWQLDYLLVARRKGLMKPSHWLSQEDRHSLPPRLMDPTDTRVTGFFRVSQLITMQVEMHCSPLLYVH